MRIRTRKSKEKLSSKQIQFLKDNYQNSSNSYLGRALKINNQAVSYQLNKYNLKRRVLLIYRRDLSRKMDIISCMELYYTGKKSIKELSEIYNIPFPTITRYATNMFFLKINKNRKIIILQSKINYD